MKSLYSRVFLITLIVIVVSSTLGFLASNMYYHVKLKPFNDEKLVGIASQMKRFLENEPADVDAYLQNAAALGYQIYLTDGDKDDRYYGRSFRKMDLGASTISKVLQGDIYHGVAQFPNKPFISGFFDNRLSNTVGVPFAAGGRQFALFMHPDVILQFGELRIFFALVGILTVAISVVLFLISTRYLVKPVTRLSEATKRIAQGNYNIVLPTKRKDEIGRLAEHFMVMSRELERTDAARQQFVSNVSHEIQSPLTSIQGFAKLLGGSRLSSEESAHYASIIEQESRHLSMLSKQLLLLSSLEQGQVAVNRKTFSLRDQVRQAVQMLQWRIEEKELLLKISIPESITLTGDDVLLIQVWMNLIGNAAQHIPAGRTITVHAEQTHAEIKVEIQDTGDGIAAEHLPFLFDRFYRADRAHERGSGSTGLGLAIVKRVLQLHEGHIEVASSPDGTCFTVTLPAL